MNSTERTSPAERMSDAIAHLLKLSTGRAPRGVTSKSPSGYTVVALNRAHAYECARAILVQFEGDPESGEATVHCFKSNLNLISDTDGEPWSVHVDFAR